MLPASIGRGLSLCSRSVSVIEMDHLTLSTEPFLLDLLRNTLRAGDQSLVLARRADVKCVRRQTSLRDWRPSHAEA